LAALEGFPASVEVRAGAGADARVAAWRAQALEGLERLDEAERHAAAAVQAARRAGDDAGVVASRGLHQRILAALAATKAVEAERRRDEALAGEGDEALAERGGTEAAALLVRKANVLADAGRWVEAEGSARGALRLVEGGAPGGAREEVLALLTLARIAAGTGDSGGARTFVLEAHAKADAAGDWNLITAVAKGAKAAGVELEGPRW
jgi:hypothetical protein